jgi:uncharacterized protein (TIGR02246 family)
VSADEDEIEDLLREWAAAIRARDLEGVVARHTENVLMFNVPPPSRGLRGIAEYRASWPPFFEYIASGAEFEFVELKVTTGVVVAYASALLRCGTPDELARDPDNLLRLTVGLRRIDGEWRIAHEHHSFVSK